MFFDDLKLEGQTSRTTINEARELLNYYLSSVQEDQTLHQCFLEVSNIYYYKKTYSFKFQEKRKQFQFSDDHLNVYLSSQGSLRAKAALENPDTNWNEGNK